MRSAGTVLLSLSVCLASGLGVAAAPAPATGADEALNGKFLATSNGQWATTNLSYHDEATVTSTWTITSVCTTPVDCTGQVVSDAGWTADLHRQNAEWTVKREVANWETCADGSAVAGTQEFRFYPASASGVQSAGSAVLIGEDKTAGPSGACGRNQWLVIRMPFKLTQIS
ncbi:MAG: hypothetical protein U0Q47_07375 [Mycobacterium sp.]